MEEGHQGEEEDTVSRCDWSVSGGKMGVFQADPVPASVAARPEEGLREAVEAEEEEEVGTFSFHWFSRFFVVFSKSDSGVTLRVFPSLTSDEKLSVTVPGRGGGFRGGPPPRGGFRGGGGGGGYY